MVSLAAGENHNKSQRCKQEENSLKFIDKRLDKDIIGSYPRASFDSLFRSFLVSLMMPHQR